VLDSQPQRTVGMTASPPAAAGIDTALLAVRQLLNNLPPSGALPSAAEQWRHDVDQLVVTAINMPHRERRCQPSAQQSRIPLKVCVGELHDGGPQGGNQLPSWWGRQPHRHRAPPREASRYRGRNLMKDFDLHAPVRGGLASHASPLTPREFFLGGGGVHGACPTPVYGGLATQVPAPPPKEVRWDGQPRRVPVDLLHLHPRCKQQ
jgi:hypothetical protein